MLSNYLPNEVWFIHATPLLVISMSMYNRIDLSDYTAGTVHSIFGNTAAVQKLYTF